MLTLIHAKNSRSTAILTLIEEMGIADKIAVREVSIRRFDGSGGPDANNPHPEKKVPALLHDSQVITERSAIMLHLTSLFPSDMAPKIGTPAWGKFAGWLVWYQGVLEPILMLAAAGASHPALTGNFGGIDQAIARIQTALADGPWLMGDRFTAADLLVASPFLWRTEMAPKDPVITDWLSRVAARPARSKVMAME